MLGGEVHETEPIGNRLPHGREPRVRRGPARRRPVLLEPIMKLEISTPDDHVGDLVGDLQQRRAIIHSTESRGTVTVLHAEAPLAEPVRLLQRDAQPEPGPGELLDGTQHLRRGAGRRAEAVPVGRLIRTAFRRESMAAFAPIASMHNCIGNWNKRQVYADPQPAQADKTPLLK